MKAYSLTIFGACVLLASVAPSSSAKGSPAQSTTKGEEALLVFDDVLAESGITFRQNSAPEKKYILESMAGGVALFDYDDDGLLDIYFVNALTVATASDSQSAPSALYKNLGGMRFEDVARDAGVAFPGWGMGACVGDYDGDGHVDLYVTTVGPDRLYRNQGDGTFEDNTERAGILADGWSAGCGFADYDRDGDVDLFVSRYVEVSLDNLPEFGKGRFCMYRGIEVQCGPRGLPGSGDLLFRNDGSGGFEEVAAKAGVADPEEYFGLGVSWFDVDGDGWLDLFVANDSGPNLFYRNQKNGTFLEEGFPLGIAVSGDGAEQGSMGIALGDVRNNGSTNLFVTNFSEEYNVFYGSDRDFFVDSSFATKTAPSSLPFVGWGTAFFDPDNDGWLDLVVANGHVYPQMKATRLGASAGYRQRKLFYRNQKDGTFTEIAEQLGEPFTQERVSRGLAVGDLDNDGRLDVVINDLDGSPQILHNQTPDAGHWLLVDLVGATGAEVLGAVITVEADGQAQRRIVRSGTSYLSQSDLRQHFGLGGASKVDRLEVLWADGSFDVEENVKVDRIHQVRRKKEAKP